MHIQVALTESNSTIHNNCQKIEYICCNRKIHCHDCHRVIGFQIGEVDVANQQDSIPDRSAKSQANGYCCCQKSGIDQRGGHLIAQYDCGNIHNNRQNTGCKDNRQTTHGIGSKGAYNTQHKCDCNEQHFQQHKAVQSCHS